MGGLFGAVLSTPVGALIVSCEGAGKQAQNAGGDAGEV
jgi:hypothetical protein